MAERISAGLDNGPPQRTISDKQATFLACGCLLGFVLTDVAVAVGLVYLVMGWLS